jgi:hypothetical protein
MAQFDVHRNKGVLRDSIPFVVVVQSAQFDRYRSVNKSEEYFSELIENCWGDQDNFSRRA